MYRVLIYWEGFPVCGLLTSELFKNPCFDVDLYVTNPSVPFGRFFENFGVIPKTDIPSNPENLNLEKYDLVLITGWNSPFWLKVCSLAKTKYNILTCLVSDNNWTGSIRQVLGLLYFRWSLRKYFDFAFCPGASAGKFLRYLGMPAEKILLGNYGAFSEIYFPPPLALKRENKFIFVGQFIERKGISCLVNAFLKYRLSGGSWNLELIGSGDLSGLVDFSQKGLGITVSSFLQPVEVAEKLRSTKVLILPSLSEHWGTVVCEAAACGCSLLLSSAVGSIDDMLMPGVNGMVFKTNDVTSLSKQMMAMQNLTESWHEQASKTSISLASCRNEHSYQNSIRYMISYAGTST